MSIHICILAGREMVHRSTAMGLASVTNGLIKGGLTFSYTIHTASVPIQLIRSEVANRFMHCTNYDWLLFVDDDIGFTGKDLNALFEVQEDLVIGACPFRALQQPRLMCLPVNPHPVDAKGGNAIEVVSGGMGFTLIHRRVFEAIKMPGLEYIPIGRPTDLAGKQCFHYFDTIVENGYPKTEDISFCERYRAAGGRIWMALKTTITHSGMHTFGFDKPLEELVEESLTTQLLGNT